MTSSATRDHAPFTGTPGPGAGVSTPATSHWRTTLLFLAAYLVACAVLYPHFQYVAFKDEVNYISVAEKFAHGDVLHAANAYFGPLLPLVIAAGIVLGLPSVVAAKIATILIGGATLLAFRALSLRFELSERVRLLLLAVAVPWLVYGAYFAVNADVLLMGALFGYFTLVFDPAYADRPRAGWFSGLLGGAAYLAKGFGLPFFAVHFVLITAAHLAFRRDRADRRRILLQFGRGVLACGIVVVLWGVALNAKYHDRAVWFGISGPYNHAIRGPAYYDLATSPSTNGGIVEPWPGTLSIWEEPYYFFKRYRPWSPLESVGALKHQAKLTRVSAANIVEFYAEFSALWVAILVGSLLLLRDPGGQRPRFHRIAALGTFVVYTGFYAALYSEERYMWPMGMLMLLLGGEVLTVLQGARLANTVARRALLEVVFALSFLHLPVRQLIVRANNGLALTRLAKGLRDAGAGGRIASNADFGNSMVLAYELRATYYGHPNRAMTQDSTVAALRRYRVSWYLGWFDRSPLPDSVARRVTSLDVDGRQLTLYSIR